MLGTAADLIVHVAAARRERGPHPGHPALQCCPELGIGLGTYLEYSGQPGRSLPAGRRLLQHDQLINS